MEKKGFFDGHTKTSVGKIMKFFSWIFSMALTVLCIALQWDGAVYVGMFLGAAGLMEVGQKIADHGMK